MKVFRVLSLFLVAASITALGQKPALVKDVDANGRVPYIHTVESDCSQSDLSACQSHVFSFPIIPTGYRLVVTHVSVRFQTDLHHPLDVSVLLTNGLPFFDQGHVAMDLQTPLCLTSSGTSNCVSSGPVSFYVEPGAIPTIVLGTGSDSAYYAPYAPRLTVVGYLISTT